MLGEPTIEGGASHVRPAGPDTGIGAPALVHLTTTRAKVRTTAARTLIGRLSRGRSAARIHSYCTSGVSAEPVRVSCQYRITGCRCAVQAVHGPNAGEPPFRKGVRVKLGLTAAEMPCRHARYIQLRCSGAYHLSSRTKGQIRLYVQRIQLAFTVTPFVLIPGRPISLHGQASRCRTTTTMRIAPYCASEGAVLGPAHAPQTAAALFHDDGEVLFTCSLLLPDLRFPRTDGVQ